MLAFAFLATFGFNGLVTILFKDVLQVDILTVVLAVRPDGARGRLHLFPDPADADHLPAPLDGLRQEWYDASASLGGGSVVVLAPRRRPDPRPGLPRRPAAAVHERVLRLRDGRRARQPGRPIITLQISSALTSEVVLGQENVGKALALGMIVIVIARDGCCTP